MKQLMLDTLKSVDHGLARLWEPNYVITEHVLGTFLEGEPLRVLDCGAAGGSLAEWNSLDDRITRYGFDPDEVECARLNERAKAAGHQHFYYPICLAERNEEGRRFYLTNHPHSHSLYPPNEKLIARWRQWAGGRPVRNLSAMGLRQITEIHTTSLDTWAKTQNVRDIDFVKLDVQGAEMEVLRGGEGLLKTSLGALVEVWFTPVYEGAPLFAEIDGYLRHEGFSFFSPHIYAASQFAGRMASPVIFKNVTTFREQQAAGQLVTADTLYLRDLFDCAEPKNVDMTKALKLACIAEMSGQVEYSFEVLAFLKDVFIGENDFAQAKKIQAIFDFSREYYLRKSPAAWLFRLLRVVGLRGPHQLRKAPDYSSSQYTEV